MLKKLKKTVISMLVGISSNKMFNIGRYLDLICVVMVILNVSISLITWSFSFGIIGSVAFAVPFTKRRLNEILFNTCSFFMKTYEVKIRMLKTDSSNEWGSSSLVEDTDLKKWLDDNNINGYRIGTHTAKTIDDISDFEQCYWQCYFLSNSDAVRFKLVWC